MAQKITVLGAGISGVGSALLAQSLGFEVLLSDRGELNDATCAKLTAAGVEFEGGGHSTERILESDLVIKSPGIPESVPLIVELRKRGVAVISEIEFAGRYMGNARTICITGSNGKTTTTSLIYKILCDAGYRVGLGGNIGHSFAELVMKGGYDWYVLELSSFQLDGMYDFHADVALLLNITPDHLDRYDHKFELYAASKMRIAQNQRPEDSFIYFEDGGVVSHLVQESNITSQRLPFAEGEQVMDGGTITKSGVVHAQIGSKKLNIDSAQTQLQGLHNRYNIAAASLAAMAAGVSEESIVQSIKTFAPVEHRLEPVAEVDGVLFINDSKATNVDSAWYALQGITRPVVWIAGGTDKGNDYSLLEALVREKVHTLIAMGTDNSPLVRAFEGVVPLISCDSLEGAMQSAVAAAHEGDVVLLSPACASFDLFKNYEHRGQLFKEWVAKHNAR